MTNCHTFAGWPTLKNENCTTDCGKHEPGCQRNQRKKNGRLFVVLEDFVVTRPIAFILYVDFSS